MQTRILRTISRVSTAIPLLSLTVVFGCSDSGTANKLAGDVRSHAAALEEIVDIHDCFELQAMEQDLSAHYRLANDVNCAGFDAGDGGGFRPVGIGGWTYTPFEGRFDGAGHIIRNLSINRPLEASVGLFGLAGTAVIERVGLEDVSIIGYEAVGAVVGATEGTLVREVYATGSTMGHLSGGLVGFLKHDGILRDSYSRLTVDYEWQGGLLADYVYYGAHIERSYSVGLADEGRLYGDIGEEGEVVASFFDCELAGDCGNPGAETTAHLQSESFLEGEGWDFTSTWGFRAEGEYPCLRWEQGCVPAYCQPGGEDSCSPECRALSGCTVECPCEAGEPGCESDTECASGFECESNGAKYGLPASTNVCVDATCGSTPAFCGSTDSRCGLCCVPSCSGKACGQDRSDGCGGICRGLCGGATGCDDDFDCHPGEWCDPEGGSRYGQPGVSRCVEIDCAVAIGDTRYCGFSGAPCGTVCVAPACTPSCEGRECGTNPGDGCGGSCGTCGAEEVCAGAGYCVTRVADPTIPGVPSIDGSLINSTPLPNDSTVNLKGSFGVVSGFASYRIPIEVPPGRAEMAPDLALAYNSGSGLTAIGFGWDVDGLSSIRRCSQPDSESQTIEELRRVWMEPTDPMCLDGKPLELASSTPTPTSPSAEYRLKFAPQIKVVAYDFDEKGPTYFTVHDGSGRVYTYGSTSDSSEFHGALEVPPPGRERFQTGAKTAWWLAETRDVLGNFIRYDYETHEAEMLKELSPGVHTRVIDTTARYLKSVAYTGKRCPEGEGESCGSTVDPDRAVLFNYTSLPEEIGDGHAPLVNPRNGGRRLLSNISVMLRDQVVREYSLTHSTVLSGHRLVGVALCVPSGISGTECSQPTTFAYPGLAELFTHETELDALPSRFRWLSPPLTDPTPVWPWLYALDANGDGLTDVLHREEITGSAEGTVLGSSWVLKLTRLSETGEVTSDARPVSLGLVQHNAPVINIDRHIRDRIFPLDYDGDGRDDLLVQRWEGQESDWNLRNVLFHSDGDGAYSEGQTLSTIGGFIHILPRLGGEPDIAICASNGTGATVHVFENIFSGTFPETPRTFTLNLGTCLGSFVADARNDGVHELFVRAKIGGGRSTYFRLEDGSFRSTGIIATPSPEPPVVLDFDGDGDDDLYLTYATYNDDGIAASVRWDLWYATPTGYEFGFSQELEQGPTGLPYKDDGSASFTTSYHVADFDGDGRDDLLVPSDRTRSHILEASHPTPVTEWSTWLVRGFRLKPSLTGALVQGYRNNGFPWRGSLASVTGDFNGDGAVDFAYVKGVDEPHLAIRFGSRTMQNPGELSTIREGQGRSIGMSYIDRQPDIRSELRYTPAAACPAGAICFKRAPAGTVASTVEGSVRNPSGPTKTTSYAYAAAQRDRYGWCGYKTEASTLVGSTRGLIYKQTLEYTHVSNLDAGATCAGSLPASVDRVVPIGEGVGSDPGSGVVYRRELTQFFRGFTGAPRLALSLRRVDHTTYEEAVPASISSDEGLQGFSGYFDSPVAVRSDEYGQPDAFGNPTNRAVTVSSIDAEGTETAISSETATAVFSIEPADLELWTVSAPSSVDWTVVSARGGDSSTRKTTIVNSRGLVNVVEEKDAADNVLLTTTYTRDDFGRTETVVEVDPLQAERTRSIEYEDHYLPTKIRQFVTSPLGGDSRVLETELDIDEATGLTLVTVDPAGLVTKRAYDGFGRPVWEDHPDGTARHIQYQLSQGGEPGWARMRVRDGVADEVGSEPEGGAEHVVFFDELDRAVALRSRGILGEWSQKERTLDELDELASETAPHELGATPDFTTILQHDALGRLTEEQSGRGRRRYSYLSRNVWAETVGDRLQFATHPEWAASEAIWADLVEDEEGAITLTARDAELKQIGVVSAVDAKTRYTYGASGELRRLIDDQGNVTKIDRDAYGRPVSLEDSESGERGFTYYGTGELREEIFDGASTAFSYDSVGRLVRREREDEEATWSWDVNGLAGQAFPGRLLRATSNDGAIAYGYDEQTGRIGAIQHEILGSSYTRSMTYDALGRLHQVTYPEGVGDTFVVEYGFDDYGHITDVSRGGGASLWSVTEATRGYLPKHISWGDGIEEELEYDPSDHQLQSISRVRTGNLVDSVAYQYWPTGNIRAKARGAMEEAYGYDSSGRITTVREGLDGSGPLKWEASYDSIGNVTYTLDSGVFSYEHADEIERPRAIASTAAGHSYLYDALGRVTSRTDPAGNQASVSYTSFDLPRTWALDPTLGDPVSMAFGYSADHTRLSKSFDATAVRYAGPYRETLVGEPGTEERSATYSIFVDSVEIARVERSAAGDDVISYLHHDRLGSVDFVGDSQGVDRAVDHMPFGGVAGGRGVAFAGHDADEDDALIDMGGRFYDAAVGRFLTPDPFIQSPYIAESLNRYSYVWNNPLNLVDPRGFESQPVAGTSGADAGEAGRNEAFRIENERALLRLMAPPVAPGTQAGTTTATGASLAAAATARVVLEYLDRNHLMTINMVGNAGAAWGEAASFGAGSLAQEALGLADAINHDSAAYKVGTWSAVITPGGWRTLVTNPLGAARSALQIGRALAAFGGNALRETLSVASKGASGVKTLVMRMVDALPVPGLGVGGVGGVTVGALRAARGLVASARALGRALEAAGHVRPRGWAAHHIVAGKARAAAPARAVLQKFGIGINEAANGVFLPGSRAAANAAGSAVHAGVHTSEYYRAVNEALGVATTRQEALLILDDIAASLGSGGFP